jgi:hypothetical protein
MAGSHSNLVDGESERRSLIRERWVRRRRTAQLPSAALFTAVIGVETHEAYLPSNLCEGVPVPGGQ